MILLPPDKTPIQKAPTELHALHPASSRVRKDKATILLLSIIVLYFIYDRSCQVSSIANMSGEPERKTISVAQLSSEEYNYSFPDMPMVERQRLRTKPNQEPLS